ncbi:hypothetical protein NL676_038478 [Syzygium grande]|nr:hypothetical protein NL676_038478 [Syzygium grande]
MAKTALVQKELVEQFLKSLALETLIWLSSGSTGWRGSFALQDGEVVDKITLAVTLNALPALGQCKKCRVNRGVNPCLGLLVLASSAVAGGFAGSGGTNPSISHRIHKLPDPLIGLECHKGMLKDHLLKTEFML